MCPVTNTVTASSLEEAADVAFEKPTQRTITHDHHDPYRPRPVCRHRFKDAMKKDDGMMKKDGMKQDGMMKEGMKKDDGMKKN